MKTHWLASYPKSGNTWFRIFLANLLAPDLAPVDPNRLPINNLISSARAPFLEIIGAPSALFTDCEIAELRPAIDQIIGEDWTDRVCLRKAHDAYTYLPDGRPIMGRGPNFSAIYILRNPWDVAVSAAHHWRKPIDKVVEEMCDQCNALNSNPERIGTQLSQCLLSWSSHAKSWLSAPLDVCLIRYENMCQEPMKEFSKAVEFLGIKASKDEISLALEASSFSALRTFEQEQGFREAPQGTHFFRRGTVGEGRKMLSQENSEALAIQNEIVEDFLANASAIRR